MSAPRLPDDGASCAAGRAAGMSRSSRTPCPPAGEDRRCTTTTSTRRSTCSRASRRSRSATKRFHAPAGELAFAPRGVPHTLAERSGARARYLLVSTPAGFERLLRPHRRGAGRVNVRCCWRSADIVVGRDGGPATPLVCTPAGFESLLPAHRRAEAGVDPPPEALEPWPRW